MMGQETRNKLTDYGKEHDIKSDEEYAILYPPQAGVSAGRGWKKEKKWKQINPTTTHTTKNYGLLPMRFASA